MSKGGFAGEKLRQYIAQLEQLEWFNLNFWDS
jgi:hypothetical protein